MAITHATVKAPGQKVFAVADWNATHTADGNLVINLNADLLDGQHGSYYLDSGNFTGANWTDLTDGNNTTLHIHDSRYYTEAEVNADFALIANVLRKDGTVPLTANWDAGNFEIHAGAFELKTGGDLRPESDSTTAVNIAQADGTNFVTFDTTNKRVGIGTASPSVALDVNGPIRTQGAVTIGKAGTGYTTLALFGGDAPGTSYIQAYNTNSLQIQTYNPSIPGYNTGLFMGTDGRVGIGTNSPSYPLHIIGNAYFSADVSALTFTDRTPYPESLKVAYQAIESVEKDSISLTLNKAKLHPILKSGEDGRDLSMSVSVLLEVIKDLIKRIEALESR